MRITTMTMTIAAAALGLAACTGGAPEQAAPAPPPAATRSFAVEEITLPATFEAAGVARPLREATLSTKLMGSVTRVLVQEGDAVSAGQPLVEIDARDLAAQAARASASVAEAEAVRRDAAAQAQRIRGLYADSAATRAQLDAVEAGLARAEAGVRAAQAVGAEVGAMRGYAVVRAPFAGVVTRRFVDPGAFAAPGAPLVSVQDGARLRIAVTAPPAAASGVRRGQSISATIEGRSATAMVEGVVPAGSGQLYTINALLDNAAGAYLPGSAATLSIPQGERRGVVVPAAAIVREGDLAGVDVLAGGAIERRWLRLGRSVGERVEVLSGLRAGDRVVIRGVGGA
jgi:RND family efflux transporter MFP subunit